MNWDQVTREAHTKDLEAAGRWCKCGHSILVHHCFGPFPGAWLCILCGCDNPEEGDVMEDIEVRLTQKEAVSIHDLLYFSRFEANNGVMELWDPEAIETLRVFEVGLHQMIEDKWPELKGEEDAINN